MSSASRAMCRLRKQCRNVLARMREKNAAPVHSAGATLLRHSPCRLEPLEPRLLLDASGPQIITHWPDGIVGASVDHLEVTFNEQVAPATFTPEDVSVVLTTPALVSNYDTPGYAFGVKVVGTLAYVADHSSGLRILDVSNPAAPVEVGSYATPGYAFDVEVVGSLAYVADDDYGLRVIDVSGPAAPTEVGYCDTPGGAHSVQIVGSLAYVADGDFGVRILDVSDPAAPVEVGFYDTPSYAYDVQVVGTLAYVADHYGGLRILDVSDPAAPVEVGFYDTGGYAQGLQVVGTLAYVADYISGLRILDVSDPAAPAEVGHCDTAWNPKGIQVVGTLAYVTTTYSGLRILDVSAPAAPTEVGYYPEGRPYGVEVIGSLAYVANYDSGLQILEVLKEVSGVTAAGGETYRIDLAGTLADGEYQVFVGPDVADLAGNLMDQDGNGVGGEMPADLYAFRFTTDTTAPLAPTDLAFADDTGSADNVTADTGLAFTWSAPQDVAGIASHEYRWDGDDWTSTAGTSSPELSGTEGEHTFEVRAVDVLDRPGAAASLTVAVDLTVPAAPTGLRLDGAVLHWDAATDAYGVWKYEVVMDGVGGADTTGLSANTGLAEGTGATFDVRAVDRADNVGPWQTAVLTADYGPRVTNHTPENVVDDPGAMTVTVTFNEPIAPATLTADDVQIALSTPTPLGAVYTNGYAEEVIVIGSLAYMADGEDGGLRIFDVSDPSTPALLGNFDTPGRAWDLAVEGTLAYVADGYAGLAIIDVSDPNDPVWVSTYDVDDAWSVVASGSLVYLGHSNGLDVIDVSNPAAPVLLGRWDDSWVGGLAVSGTTAYLACYNYLRVVDVSDSSSPQVLGLIETGGQAWDVTVSGSTAYVAAGDNGLQIFDVSDPQAPVLLGGQLTAGEAVDVEVSGTVVYVTEDRGDGLSVIDVSDPASPAWLGAYGKSFDSPEGVAVVGPLAYVAAGDSLQILKVREDVSGITAVDAVTYRIDLPGELPDNRYRVVVGPDVTNLAGNTMDQDSNGVGGVVPTDVYSFEAVVDATPPAAPEDLGYADDTGSMDNVTADELLTFSWSAPRDFAGIASYEYCLDGGTWAPMTGTSSPALPAPEGGHTFEVRAIDTFGRVGQTASLSVVVDTTAPGAPAGLRLIGGAILQWDTATDANGIWKYQGHVDSGAWSDAFFPQARIDLGDGVGGLCEVRAVDKAGNVGPVAAATLTPDYGPQVVGRDVEVTVNGECSFTVTFNEPVDASTFTAEDVLIPRTVPQPVATGYVPGGYVDEVIASGTRAYVIIEGAIQILDASDPYSPVYLGELALFPGIEGGDISGTMGYLTMGDGGLVIIDMSDPASPQTFPAFDMGGWAYQIKVSGTRAYVMVRDVGLQILDVSDPSSPVLLGGLEPPDEAEIVTVTDTLVCLIGRNNGIYTVDVSNPASPTLLSHYALDTDPGTVVGTMVYMADDFLRILDFSNPIEPVLLGSYDAGGWIEGVVVSGTVAFLEFEDQGLQIVDLSNPAAPELLSTYDVDQARSVSLFGTVAYLAVGSNGLVALEVMQKVAGVTALDATTYRIDLADAIGEGEYHVFVGPDVADLAGNSMDQDRNGVGGQPSDIYNFRFTFGGPASVLGRHVFYNNSSLDGNTPGASSQDDGAIATDKQALIGDDSPSGTNGTAYSRGLNGIMVDIDGFANPGGLNVGAIGDYLGFKVGTNDNPSTWASAPAPLEVSVRSGAGVDGSDRVTIIWADNAIQREWLQVTVKAGAATGLVDDDVFYFGNLVGDATGDGVVDASDYIALKRAFGSSVASPGGSADFDCSGAVDYGDLAALTGSFGQSISMALATLAQVLAAVPAMASITTGTPDIIAEPAGAMAVPEPDVSLAGEEAAAAAAMAELPMGVHSASLAPQATAGILDVLAYSVTPQLATTPSTPPLLSPVMAGHVFGDVLQLAAPWWPGDSARHELPDEPWMARSTVDIAGKPRKDPLDPIGLDLLAVSR